MEVMKLGGIIHTLIKVVLAALLLSALSTLGTLSALLLSILGSLGVLVIRAAGHSLLDEIHDDDCGWV